MNTLTIGVSSRDEINARFLQAMQGQAQGAFRSFESDTALWKTLTHKRWELLKIMSGQGEMSIREAARRIQRDVKSVHGDVQVLLNAGLLDKTASGKIIFPFDSIHVDFTLKSAA